ncbi:MAG: cbb3-type cytochrome c oxidase subunit II [Planctomycetaceae bacterium]
MFLRMGWHRRWERLPMYFTFWVIVAVVAASLFEIIPTFLIRSNVPTIASVQPYTPLELVGRDIYVSEGCYSCHSQMIRPILSRRSDSAIIQKPGRFVRPAISVESRRIGRSGSRGKQSHLWHLVHLREPSSLVKGSIMPSFAWLEPARTELQDDSGSRSCRQFPWSTVYGQRATKRN